jgi:hypothetical protein
MKWNKKFFSNISWEGLQGEYKEQVSRGQEFKALEGERRNGKMQI